MDCRTSGQILVWLGWRLAAAGCWKKRYAGLKVATCGDAHYRYVHFSVLGGRPTKGRNSCVSTLLQHSDGRD